MYTRVRVLAILIALAALTVSCDDSETEAQRIERQVRAEYSQKMWLVGGALAIAGIIAGVAMSRPRNG